MEIKQTQKTIKLLIGLDAQEHSMRKLLIEKDNVAKLNQEEVQFIYGLMPLWLRFGPEGYLIVPSYHKEVNRTINKILFNGDKKIKLNEESLWYVYGFLPNYLKVKYSKQDECSYVYQHNTKKRIDEILFKNIK